MIVLVMKVIWDILFLIPDIDKWWYLWFDHNDNDEEYVLWGHKDDDESTCLIITMKQNYVDYDHDDNIQYPGLCLAHNGMCGR